MRWFGARTLYRIEREGSADGATLIEHRIVLLEAADADQAIVLAEKDARTYASELDWVNAEGERINGRYLEVCDVFELTEHPGPGVEVYSSTILDKSGAGDAEVVNWHFGPERDEEIERQHSLFEPDFEQIALRHEAASESDDA